MKVYSYYIGRIMPKIDIHEYILPNFLKNFINLYSKSNKIQGNFQQPYHKKLNVRFGSNLRIKFSLLFALQKAYFNYSQRNFKCLSFHLLLNDNRFCFIPFSDYFLFHLNSLGSGQKREWIFCTGFILETPTPSHGI